MFNLLSSKYFLYLLFVAVFFGMFTEFFAAINDRQNYWDDKDSSRRWSAPSLYLSAEPSGEARQLLIYGEDLITNTSFYFGPFGKLRPMSNGMNCQNCHLDGGTRPWGNNYAMVASTYPKFRARSGTVESLYKRVNDCFERSLNGQPIDSNSHEFAAISAYINWIGTEVHKGDKPEGSGIERLSYLDRAADPLHGRTVYASACSSCHGMDGQGLLLEARRYQYPPLWGPHSYTDAAGMFRLSNFAGFVKNNMPFGSASHGSALLSDEDAWDVAAFVNSQPRPSRDQHLDWPDISKKPIDFPEGPYSDSFTETQHKYGPFKPIAALRKE